MPTLVELGLDVGGLDSIAYLFLSVANLPMPTLQVAKVSRSLSDEQEGVDRWDRADVEAFLDMLHRIPEETYASLRSAALQQIHSAFDEARNAPTRESVKVMTRLCEFGDVHFVDDLWPDFPPVGTEQLLRCSEGMRKRVTVVKEA